MTNWVFLGWFYFQDGEQFGPVPGEEIVRLLACGQLRPCEEVWTGWRHDSLPTVFFDTHAQVCGAAILARSFAYSVSYQETGGDFFEPPRRKPSGSKKAARRSPSPK